MDVAAVVERVREVSSVSDGAGSSVSRSSIESAIRSSAEIKAWLAAADARLATALAAEVSFPEQTIAECTRESVRDAAKTRERADTLGKVPGFADALGAAAITARHVDAITATAKPLTDEQRTEYFDRVAGLVDVASAATVDDFRKRLAQEARATERDDGMERLERQRRRTGSGCGPTARACGASTAGSTPRPVSSSMLGWRRRCRRCSPSRCPTPAPPTRCSSSSTSERWRSTGS